MQILYLDVETTTKNKGHPFDPDNFLVSVTHCVCTNPVCFNYLRDPDFLGPITREMGCAEICGFNIKFDLHWLARYGRVFVEPRVWDCMLAEYIISGQKNGFMSLNETLSSYGLPVKPDKIREYWDAGISTEHIPINELQEYAEWDVACLPLIRSNQQALMTPEQINLCYLMGEDLKALQAAEFAGIKYDDYKADKLINETQAALNDIKQGLAIHLPDSCREYFNWNSGDHVSAFLYGGRVDFEYSVPESAVYKSGAKSGQAYTKNRWFRFTVDFEGWFPPPLDKGVSKNETQTNKNYHRYQCDEPTLKSLRATSQRHREILQLLNAYASKEKVVSMAESLRKTMVIKNWQDNTLHPQFNQNIAITGRLSSSAP